jgi:hypothetical protein
MVQRGAGLSCSPFPNNSPARPALGKVLEMVVAPLGDIDDKQQLLATRQEFFRRIGAYPCETLVRDCSAWASMMAVFVEWVEFVRGDFEKQPSSGRRLRAMPLVDDICRNLHLQALHVKAAATLQAAPIVEAELRDAITELKASTATWLHEPRLKFVVPEGAVVVIWTKVRDKFAELEFVAKQFATLRRGPNGLEYHRLPAAGATLVEPLTLGVAEPQTDSGNRHLWSDSDRDKISDTLSGQKLKLFRVLWAFNSVSPDRWKYYSDLKALRAEMIWRGQPDPAEIEDKTVFEALRKLQQALPPESPYLLTIENESCRVKLQR